MAKKPMRTAVGRGQDRAATIKAQTPIVMKATQRSMEEDKVSWGESIRRAKASQAAGQKADKLRKESERIQTSGARMGRAMAAAKAKQKPK